METRQEIDEVIPLGSLSWDIYRLIQSLEPFGEGNPTPVFLSRGVQVTNVRTIGGGEQRLRLKLKDQGGMPWPLTRALPGRMPPKPSRYQATAKWDAPPDGPGVLRHSRG